jgi:hypothetical protein
VTPTPIAVSEPAPVRDAVAVLAPTAADVSGPPSDAPAALLLMPVALSAPFPLNAAVAVAVLAAAALIVVESVAVATVIEAESATRAPAPAIKPEPTELDNPSAWLAT